MARVNERREARGQEALVNKKFADPDYAKRYIDEAGFSAANKPSAINPSVLPKINEPPASSLETTGNGNDGFKKRSNERLGAVTLGEPLKSPEERNKEFQDRFTSRLSSGRLGQKEKPTTAIQSSLDRMKK